MSPLLQSTRKWGCGKRVQDEEPLDETSEDAETIAAVLEVSHSLFRVKELPGPCGLPLLAVLLPSGGV